MASMLSWANTHHILIKLIDNLVVSIKEKHLCPATQRKLIPDICSNHQVCNRIATVVNFGQVKGNGIGNVNKSIGSPLWNIF